MKKLIRVFFPLRGEVDAANFNLFNWKVQVTFLGILIVVGHHNDVDLRFDHTLGISIQDALAVEIDKSIPTELGIISRYGENYNEDPNMLRIHVHHYWFMIDRRELEKFASR